MNVLNFVLKSSISAGCCHSFSVKMGQSNSIHKVRPAVMQDLLNTTIFDANEITDIYRAFRSIAKSNKKCIFVSEFMDFMQIESCGYARRIMSGFGMGASQCVTFPQVVKGLSALSSAASIEQRAKFCFAMYDCSCDGAIDRTEMRELFRCVLENTDRSLPTTQIEALINRTFNELDSNGDGMITYEDLLLGARKHPGVLSPFKVEDRRFISELPWSETAHM